MGCSAPAVQGQAGKSSPVSGGLQPGEQPESQLAFSNLSPLPTPLTWAEAR